MSLSYPGSCRGIITPLTSLENILKTQAECGSKKRVACRQEYILLKSLDQAIADEFSVRNWIEHYFAIDPVQQFHEDFNPLYFNRECYRNMEFPSIVLNGSVNFDAHDKRMFKEEDLKISSEQSENADTFGEPMFSNTESSSKKTRNTMNNFLHGQMPKGNHFSSARQILALQNLKVRRKYTYLYVCMCCRYAYLKPLNYRSKIMTTVK